jgi:hypothetical protein
LFLKDIFIRSPPFFSERGLYAFGSDIPFEYSARNNNISADLGSQKAGSVRNGKDYDDLNGPVHAVGV